MKRIFNFWFWWIAASVWIAVSVGVSEAKGAAEGSTSSSSAAGGSASISAAVSGNDVVVTYSWSPLLSGHTGQGVGLYAAPSSGVYGAQYFYYNAGSGGSGTYTVVNGASTPRWYALYTLAGYASGGTQTPAGEVWFFASNAPFRIHIPDITNPSPLPAEIRMTQGGTPIGSPVPLAPAGSPASPSFPNGDTLPGADYTVPGGGAVGIQMRFPSLETDGPAWFEVPVTSGSGTTATVATITPNQTSTPPVATVTPPVVPNAPVQPNNTKTIWVTNTGGASALDSQTYREGTDKIIAAVKANAGGAVTDMTSTNSKLDTSNAKLEAIRAAVADLPSGVSAQTFSTTTTETTSANQTAVLGVLSKLPSAPTLSAPSASHTVAFNFPIYHGDTVVMNVDFAQFDVGINLFKLLTRSGMAVAFFFAVVRTLRGAFASEK